MELDFSLNYRVQTVCAAKYGKLFKFDELVKPRSIPWRLKSSRDIFTSNLNKGVG
jgi:hypothetical protein